MIHELNGLSETDFLLRTTVVGPCAGGPPETFDSRDAGEEPPRMGSRPCFGK
jgi:hypothetical protein